MSKDSKKDEKKHKKKKVGKKPTTVNKMQKRSLDEQILIEYTSLGLKYPTVQDLANIVQKYRPHRNEKNNYLYAWRLINNRDYREKLSRRLNRRVYTRVLTIEERMQYLTDVIMGEIEPDATVKSKLECIKELNRMDGVGVTSTNALIVNNAPVSLEDQRAIVQNRLNELLGVTVDKSNEKEVIEVIPNEDEDE